MSDAPNAITKTYDLLKWLMPAVSKYPKDKRFTLGARIEDKLLSMLELLINANYSREKLDYLKKANLDLEVFRHLIRLSFDLRFIDLRRYEYVSREADEIGRLIGGWIKQQAAK
jgi:hypothetical protein